MYDPFWGAKIFVLIFACIFLLFSRKNSKRGAKIFACAFTVRFSFIQTVVPQSWQL